MIAAMASVQVPTPPPSMPYPNLRHAQMLVRKFCPRHNISYPQCGVFCFYGHALRHLHEVGTPLRAVQR
jgi:hypothetical protein